MNFAFQIVAHPSCLKMSARMVRRINEYAWQCQKCKQCIKCRRSDNEDKMLFCNQCDRSYHIYCIGLRKIPNGIFIFESHILLQNFGHFLIQIISS